MKREQITLLGNPQSNNSLYKAHGHFVYMTNRGKTLKESYQWQAIKQHGKKPLKGKLEVDMVLYFGNKRKHDADNYFKLILDSGNGILWEDDSQIYRLTVEKKLDIKRPRIELSIYDYL